MTRDMEVARSVLWAPVYTEAQMSLLCKQSEPRGEAHSGVIDLSTR